MNNDVLAQDAISNALKGNWKKAVIINKKILETDPDNVDALNRLCKAYAELGNILKAKKTARIVLKKDQFNNIAKKTLEKLNALKKLDINSSPPTKPDVFIEEPGKTKIFSLLHLGDNTMMAKLDAGDEILINHHSHRVSANTIDGKYIGKLPDDLSARLKKLIGLGYSYKAVIKSADKKDVKILIRETYRSKKHIDFPSFPPEKIEYISFTAPELVHKKNDDDFMDEDEEE
ncbi:hypothetical protein A2955_04185 [Candidatus Woesebacteria bacterium RIFCSPLOWO2_01_FULL_37_19]|uniref:Uncharacterized protein n=2 Tax=Candidatus Woeseibacteriota TaxID=1752722 RepID=A0A1F8B1A0_9BACT|nr:MAG: hypothetical protein A2771_01210 [Candidatus Woesebacteria bacterium RIFCSPHIGHO2_01_FULL_38_26b]OGM57519.1 MAG: hypothetical protein A2955_04185 [Candidatus Woesebacteria bacterium RIFCSPLOWO2_01_FULL_37_19]